MYAIRSYYELFSKRRKKNLPDGFKKGKVVNEVLDKPRNNFVQHTLYEVIRKEQTEIVDSTSDASRLYSPIVKIKTLPSTLRPGNGTLDRYEPIELEDLSSLAKLTYGFEENPFPLFLFPHKDNWLIGVFMNFTEDGTSYFCHVVLNKDPQKPFLKFTNNNSEPDFVESPTEHGFSYVKIIKLKDTHPLVDYGHLQNQTLKNCKN